MKLFLLFLFSLPVFAQSLSERLEGKKYYYSALNEFFIETYHRPVTQKEVERLEHLLFFTGIEILEDYDHQLLEKYPTSSTFFILARRAFHRKDHKKAVELFTKVHPDHRYYPEAQLIKAQVFIAKNDQSGESEAYESCQKSAQKQEDLTEGEKIKRYYRMIYEICLVNKGRRLFKAGKYQEALSAYNQISKQSYKWPFIILEKAWVYYMLGDYNRSLGLLVTYKSPLLETYFFPEAEYLAALSYYRLCLYQDALTVINQYYQFYRPRFLALDGVLKKNKDSQNYFYNLMFKPGDELKKHEEFVRQIVTRLKKQTRFSLDFNTIHKLKKEMKLISQHEKKAAQDELLGHLAAVRENMMTKINYNAKNDIFQFLETVPFFSSELFKLNLEIISRKKDLVYSSRQLISDRSRGDLSNVSRSKHEQFWKFEGEFWADELGDYSMGLKSNCQIVREDEKRKE